LQDVGNVEAARTIIDTDLLIDLLRNEEEVVAFITEIEKETNLLSTTSINAFELYYGAHKSKKFEQNLQATRTLLTRLIVLPLTTRSAQKAGHIFAELEKEGQPIGLRDTFIGAIALTKGFSIATRNTVHFNKIKGLKIITVQSRSTLTKWHK
jgi:tRNA(fMet)-specific endonuclease VapC